MQLFLILPTHLPEFVPSSLRVGSQDTLLAFVLCFSYIPFLSSSYRSAASPHILLSPMLLSLLLRVKPTEIPRNFLLLT